MWHNESSKKSFELIRGYPGHSLNRKKRDAGYREIAVGLSLSCQRIEKETAMSFSAVKSTLFAGIVLGLALSARTAGRNRR